MEEYTIGTKSNAFLNIHLYTDGYCLVKEDFPYDYVAEFEALHFFYNINIPGPVNDPSTAIITSEMAISFLETILKNLTFSNNCIAHDVSEVFLLAINDIKYNPRSDIYRESNCTVHTIIQFFPFVPTIDNHDEFFEEVNKRNN